MLRYINQTDRQLEEGVRRKMTKEGVENIKGALNW